MTAEEFTECGVLLYGPAWHPPLSKRLKVHLRTVYRWGRGERRIKATVEAKMMKLMAERQKTLAATISKHQVNVGVCAETAALL